jgi:hypothetical protein
MQVGVVISLGVTLPLWSQVPVTALFFPTLCFALLATLNCVLIALWEKPLDLAQGFHSINLSKSRVWLTAGMIAFIGLMFMLSFWQVFYIPLLLATLALLGLQLARERFSLAALRVLADAVLLTPLLVWCFSA